MARTALITGVSGQDGSYLAEYLLDKNYHVFGLLRRTAQAYVPENIRRFYTHPKFKPVYGDLLDGEFINDFIMSERPDEVYNLAAQSVPADSWKNPTVTAEITALGPLRLLEAMARHNEENKFYHASSREIHGGVNVEVVNEDTPLYANNPYGVAKLYAHQMVDVYRQSYGMFACAGVLFNHESPRRGLHFVTRKVTMATAIIQLGLYGESPVLNEHGQPLVDRDGKVNMGNLRAQRDWGHADDYVEAMWLMMQQDEPQDYVIATNTLYSVQDLCEISFATVGLDWEEHVRIDANFTRPTEITDSMGDYSKAERELQWRPRRYFAEIIEEMVHADIERLSTQ